MSLQVSVVVPTCRRDPLLNRCLEALERQSLCRRTFEILVVDDGASGDTRRLVEYWTLRSRVPVRYLRTPGARGPAAARNLGWRAARAPVIAFTDDDCVPDSQWLARGLAALSPQTDALAGRVLMPTPAVPTDYQRDAARLSRAGFVTANCFCRRAALEHVGGFDERFRAAWREDSDLYFSLMEAGLQVAAEPRAMVLHPIRPARWGVSLQQQRKNLYNALLFKKHPRLYRRHVQSRPPWRYYAIVAGAALAAAASAAGAIWMAFPALAAWLALTAQFFANRLRGASHALSHVAEMALTSVFIPPLAVYWRLRGAWRFRVVFL